MGVRWTPADSAGQRARKVPRTLPAPPTAPDAMTAPPSQPTAPPARDLLALLAAHTAIPGKVLAAQLGVSRAAIWKQVEQLRAAGVAISASNADGYRLDAPIELLDADAITAALPTAMRRRLGELELHWRIDSTNSALLRRIDDGLPDRSVCLAELQSAGRGRRGRAWQMPLGGGLALSCHRICEGAMVRLAGLSLVAGLAALDALADCGVEGVGLKWPNDLFARDAKLGGILVELGGEALGPCHAVIGIGINLRLGAHAAQIDQRAIDVAALAALPSRNQLAARLIFRLDTMIDQFLRDGFAVFAARHAQVDVLRGRDIEILRGTRREQGVAAGVDPRGALRVRFAEGEQVIDSGEVSVRAKP